MPTKENEQIFDNREEILKKNIADKSSVHKSQKILPFLNAKAEFHQNRINTIDEKIAVRQDKILRNEAKIEKLSAKADRLEDMNTMLKNVMNNIPAVKKIIKINENKINALRNEKIPARQEKIQNHKDRIEMLKTKKNTIQHKLDRVIALSDTVTSFSIGINKERREIFEDSINRLNIANAECLNDKKIAFEDKKSQLVEMYNDPDISMLERRDIQQKIDTVSEKINNINDKIEKIPKSEIILPNKKADEIIENTAENIADAIDKENISVPKISAAVAENANKSAVLDNNYLANAEMQIEDDYNSIDGIINNGSKSELEAAKKELSETLNAMNEIVGNKYMAQWLREDTAKEIPKTTAQLDAVNKALEKFNVQEKEIPKNNTIDDDMKINPEFYKSLPKENRYIESMTVNQAEKVMQKLENSDIPFSAVKCNHDKTAVTVDKSNIDIFRNALKESMNELAQSSNTVWKQAYEERKIPEKSINPDYARSIEADERYINVETSDIGKKIMEQLDNNSVPYSAVERKNQSAAITVSNDDAKKYDDISDTVKTEQAAKYVNVDFYKSLDKENRITKYMSQEEAEKTINELEKMGIEHSAVINGDNSAVTVEKKSTKPERNENSEKAVFFSRAKLKQSAQRISNKEKSPDKPKVKNKNQGLE